MGAEISHHHQILTNASHLAATAPWGCLPVSPIMAGLSNPE